MLGCNQASTTNTTTTSTAENTKVINKVIDADAFEKGISDVENITLIDVRTPAEVEEGYIDGAILLNYNDPQFATKLAELNKETPTYIYCRSGGRSGNTAAILKDLGFKEVYDLKGGITEWEKQNKTITTF